MIINNWFLKIVYWLTDWLLPIFYSFCHLYLRISSMNVVLHGICSCARVWHPSWVTILQTVHFILIPFLNKKKAISVVVATINCKQQKNLWNYLLWQLNIGSWIISSLTLINAWRTSNFFAKQIKAKFCENFWFQFFYYKILLKWVVFNRWTNKMKKNLNVHDSNHRTI